MTLHVTWEEVMDSSTWTYTSARSRGGTA